MTATSNPNHVEFAKLRNEITEQATEIMLLREAIVTMNETMTAILVTVEDVRTHVAPAVEALANSPMMKILTGGKN